MRLRVIVNLALMTVLLAGVIVMAVPVAMRFAEEPYMYEDVADVPQAQAALVLGASVYHGAPSPILEERASAAAALYLQHKVSKILVTGDNGSLSHDEVTPVRKYLLDMGVAPKDIFLDHAGFDTYSSMYRARDVFDVHSAVIVTQDFHLPRSLFIARSLGITANGISPQGGGEARDYVREIPASLKALVDVVLHRVPKYLGESIPITGDGEVSWY